MVETPITEEAVRAIDVSNLIKKDTLVTVEWLALIVAGKSTWNEWVEKHPKTDVNLTSVDFGDLPILKKVDRLDFMGFKFPEGNVSFWRANFGDNNVNFSQADFGDGLLHFDEATFGDGYVNFNEVTIGKGHVSFQGVNFGKGEVNFTKAKFGEGPVHFREASFDGGPVNFKHASFGEGYIDFTKAKFGDGDVCFYNTEFGIGDVYFKQARFERSDAMVTFNEATFGQGTVDFSRMRFLRNFADFQNTNFGQGSVMFIDTLFWKCAINFENATFGGGHLWFTPRSLKRCTQLTFYSARLDCGISFSRLNLPVPLNLTNANLKHPLNLHNVSMRYKIQPYLSPFSFALNKYDSVCFRTLKTLAKANNDHERALEFYAQEMRASYWHDDLKGWFVFPSPKLLFFYFYDWFSNYGRSVFRPLTALGACTLGFAKIYQHLATESKHYTDALMFSASQTLPFYFGARDAKSSAVNRLFVEKPDELPNLLHSITLGQGVLSGIFLFLIALALRNIFRS